MAGVAGLPETSNINGCDAHEAEKEPVNAATNPVECRTLGEIIDAYQMGY